MIDGMDEGPIDIYKYPLHLGSGATVSVEPEFTGETSWFEDYAARHVEDGIEGRLLSMSTFSESWGTWEMHPMGSEVVLCVSGRITLHQEAPGGETTTITLGAGQYALNGPGVWHTADVDGAPPTVLFITAGAGTEHRPR
jgi:quercetin dioxygenase-like cupin family protein